MGHKPVDDELWVVDKIVPCDVVTLVGPLEFADDVVPLAGPVELTIVDAVPLAEVAELVPGATLCDAEVLALLPLVGRFMLANICCIICQLSRSWMLLFVMALCGLPFI